MAKFSTTPYTIPLIPHVPHQTLMLHGVTDGNSKHQKSQFISNLPFHWMDLSILKPWLFATSLSPGPSVPWHFGQWSSLPFGTHQAWVSAKHTQMVEHGVFGGSKITTGQIDQIAHVFYHNFKERLQDLKSSPARSPLPWHLPALHLPHGAAILATPDPSPNGQPYNATAPQRHARERSAFFRHVARGTWHNRFWMSKCQRLKDQCILPQIHPNPWYCNLKITIHSLYEEYWYVVRVRLNEFRSPQSQHLLVWRSATIQCFKWDTQIGISVVNPKPCCTYHV